MKIAALLLLAVTLPLTKEGDASTRPLRDRSHRFHNRLSRLQDEYDLRKSARSAEAQQKYAPLEALRADLASPWTSLVVAHHDTCTCSGLYLRGFEITRSQGVATISQWVPRSGYVDPFVSRTLSAGDLDSVILVVPLHYLTAILAQDPYEAAAPGDWHTPGWRARYVKAGGHAFYGDDRQGIEIRITTPEGVKTYVDYFDHYTQDEFNRWMLSMHTGKHDTAMMQSGSSPMPE